MSFAEQTHRIFNVQNIKKHDEARGSIRSAGAFADEVPGLGDHIRDASLLRMFDRRTHHQRVDVQRMDHSGSSPRRGDRKGSISATKFDDVTGKAIKAKRLHDTVGLKKSL